MFKKHIKITNEKSIADAIASIRGNATAWSFTSSDLNASAEEAEQTLEAVAILKKERVGAVATITSGGPSAKAYKYGVTGTKAMLKRYSEGWRLVSYERRTVYPRQQRHLSITLPHEHKATLPTDCLRRLGIGFAEADSVEDLQPEMGIVRPPGGR